MVKRLLVLVAFACVSLDATAQRASVKVSDRDVETYASLLAMTDSRMLDMNLVEHALTSNWRTLRGAAALAVGQVGPDVGTSGSARLRALLKDRDRGVAANAAYALGLLRDTAAISQLGSAVAANDEVAREAAWALGEIGAPARGAIVAALGGNHDGATAIQLLLASSKLRPLPFPAIEPYLQHPVSSVVWAAAYTVARSRSAAGVRDLIKLASSPRFSSSAYAAENTAKASEYYLDPATAGQRTRAEIARALAKSAAGDSLRTQAIEVLTRFVTDQDPHVRINALRSIATYGTAQKERVVAAVRDPDPNVRIAAAQSLGTVLTADAADFTTLWAADSSLVYRSSLIASATRAGLRPPQLKEWGTSTDWRMRAAVANATGDSLDRSFALARTLPLIADRDPRVREAAYGAISPATSLPLEDSVHSVLISGLRDPDFYVRATVLGALADRPSISDLTPVLASYGLARIDSANDARLAAIQYVAALWKKDSASFSSQWRDQLAQLPVPTDPLERAAGKGVAPLAKWASVKARPRALTWYTHVVREMVVPLQSGRTINATIRTVRGPIRLELFGADAPITAFNFLTLARSGYYRNTRFHRVVPNFVAQDGDPRDDGNGGPGYAIRDEMNRHRYERGAVGMALSGPDTGGSQYFITHSPQPHLDGHYTVFGRVISGYDVLDRIVQGDLITTIDPR